MCDVWQLLKPGAPVGGLWCLALRGGLHRWNCVCSQDEIEDEHLGTGNKDEIVSEPKWFLGYLR